MFTGKKVATFKERFSILLSESDKTATELAKDLRVSNQTISAWKTGERSPKEPTVIMIAQHFGVNIDWLFGFDVEKEAAGKASDSEKSGAPKTIEAQIISSKVDRLTEDQRKTLLKLVNDMFDVFESK